MQTCTLKSVEHAPNYSYFIPTLIKAFDLFGLHYVWIELVELSDNDHNPIVKIPANSKFESNINKKS